MVQPQNLVEAFCLKCREKHPIASPTRKILKNGSRAMVGSCIKCGSRVFRFISDDTITIDLDSSDIDDGPDMVAFTRDPDLELSEEATIKLSNILK